MMLRKLLIALLVVMATLMPLNFAPPILTYIAGPLGNKAAKQIEYAKKHFDSPNTKQFVDLKEVDCANFVSQTLIARGWKMDENWWFKRVNGQDDFSRAWISSTAFRNYLKSKPHLGKELTWEDRDQVVVGDIVQFDWDSSGDRDHTAVVSGILVMGDSREIRITSHSPGEFNLPISTQLARHKPGSKVYFWHLND